MIWYWSAIFITTAEPTTRLVIGLPILLAMWAISILIEKKL